MCSNTTLPAGTPEHPHRAESQDSDTSDTLEQSPSADSFDESPDLSFEAVLNNLGLTIPEVPVQFFKDYLLPPLPDNVDTAEVVASLRCSGDITTSNRWKAFPTDPRLCEDEAATFQRLEEVVEAISKKSGLDSNRLTVKYEGKTNDNPHCGYVHGNNKPDAFMVFCSRVPTEQEDGSAHRSYHWRDICCPAEFRLDDRDEDLADVSDLAALHLTCADCLLGCEEDLLGYVSGDVWGCPSSIRRRVHH